MTLSKRAMLNPKQQSKHSKTGQKASNVFYLGWPLTGAGYLVVVGRNWGGGGGGGRGGAGSEQDEIDRVQITTIQ